MPKFWRVTIKGGRKAHLTKFTPDFGSQGSALCGKLLPEDRRKGSAATINEPIGNECVECLYSSGHLQRPKVKMGPEDRHMSNALNVAKFLRDHLDMTPDEIKGVFDRLPPRSKVE
jgi:hypothetical protein